MLKLADDAKHAIEIPLPPILLLDVPTRQAIAPCAAQTVVAENGGEKMVHVIGRFAAAAELESATL
ncbi:MAG TPA: hypothetical protein VGA46_07855 [Methyloceanibacter sp.]|jgi:hypothetical protein